MGRDLAGVYGELKKWAEKRAVFSVGVAVFDPDDAKKEGGDAQPTPEGDEAGGKDGGSKAASAGPPSNYRVTVFNLIMCPQGEYTVVSSAGKFLSEHGFDFNQMFTRGIKYDAACVVKKGDSATLTSGFIYGAWPRGLLYRLGKGGVPLVVHNGLLDLAILYAAFHAPLPPTLQGFIRKLLDACPAGFFDTKVLASADDEWQSYLGFAYASAVSSGCVRVKNRKNLNPASVYDPPDRPRMQIDKLCPFYAAKGFCHAADCQLVHNPYEAVAARNADELPKNLSAARKARLKIFKEAHKKRVETEKEAEATRPKAKKMNKKARARAVAEEEKARQMAAIGNVAEEEVEGVNGRDAAASPVYKKSRSDLVIPDVDAATNVENVESARPIGGNVEQEPKAPKVPKEVMQDPPVGKVLDKSADDQFRTLEHTAGYDAFITAYTFAFYMRTMSKGALEKMQNRIKAGKARELRLMLSRFDEPGGGNDGGAADGDSDGDQAKSGKEGGGKAEADIDKGGGGKAESGKTEGSEVDSSSESDLTSVGKM